MGGAVWRSERLLSVSGLTGIYDTGPEKLLYSAYFILKSVFLFFLTLMITWIIFS